MRSCESPTVRALTSAIADAAMGELLGVVCVPLSRTHSLDVAALS